MKRAVLYLRVSTTDQTTANQERELREVASRMGCKIVRVYKDHGISGAKGRDRRPEFDRTKPRKRSTDHAITMSNLRWAASRSSRAHPRRGAADRGQRGEAAELLCWNDWRA
jgi:hypothetical protein